MVVHGSEPLPQFWKKGVELPQSTERLQGAAPAGHTPENIIQATPIEPSLPAVAQAVGFGHAPIHQGVVVFPHPMGFVGGNAYILGDVVFLLQFFQVSANDPLLQPSGTPALLGAGPAETTVFRQGRVFTLRRILIEKVFEAVGRFQPGDGPAGVLLHLVQMLVHLRKLQSGVAEKDHVHRHLFLQHTQQQSGAVFPAGE